MTALTALKRVEIARGIVGICHMQVCVVPDATDEEIIAVCNQENPAGTTNGWVRVVRNGDRQGPMPCANHEGRIHLLVAC